MSTLNDKLFNLGMMYGSGMRARQNEHDTIETLKAALNQGKDGTNSTISGNGGKIDYDNAIINGFNQFAANSDSPFTRMMRANSDGSLYNVDPNSGTKLQATQASPYNASADYGVDLNNPYSMAIMNAKNDYARAQKLGDEAAMLRAHATAEQARQQAQAAGAPIQSFLATNNADYNQALALQDQLRAAQVAGNQGFSYQDLVDGKLLNPQITNPTQGVVEQAPTNAGTAPATAAKGVTTPTVGNQQTVQTPTAPNTYDIQAGWNLIKNRQNGGSANPFQMGGQGVLNPLDPNYKAKLILSLKDKGFSYAAIDKALQLSGVDSQIASAQKAQYQNMFLNAMRQGDWGSAGMALANLAGIDKAGASMLGAYYPSYKDNWTEGNKRQDAKTNFGYQQRMAKQKHIYGQEDMRTKAQLQTMANAKILQDKAAIEQNGKLAYAKQLISMGVPQEQVMAMLTGGARKTSTTSGGRANNNETYIDNSGMVHYDKDTDKEMSTMQDEINGLQYDVKQIQGPDDPLRASTGDKHAELLKKLEILRPKITDDDYRTMYETLYAINQQRDLNSGFNAK